MWFMLIIKENIITTDITDIDYNVITYPLQVPEFKNIVIRDSRYSN